MAELPSSMKHITVWLLAGTAVLLGVQAWQAEQQRSRVQVDGSQVTLKRAADGHFHWPAQVNGIAVDFLVDTGATRTALPAALAQRAGLLPEGVVQSNTAGGVVQGWVTRADIELQGGVRAERLRVVALPDLATPLLGMDVLSRLRLQQDGATLRIDASGSP